MRVGGRGLLRFPYTPDHAACQQRRRLPFPPGRPSILACPPYSLHLQSTAKQPWERRHPAPDPRDSARLGTKTRWPCEAPALQNEVSTCHVNRSTLEGRKRVLGALTQVSQSWDKAVTDKAVIKTQ